MKGRRKREKNIDVREKYQLGSSPTCLTEDQTQTQAPAGMKLVVCPLPKPY